jgi:hypothetical protein
VLSFATGEAPKGLPRAEDAVGKVLSDTVATPKTTLRRAIYEKVEDPLGPDYTSLAPASGMAMEIGTDFQLKPVAKGTRVRLLALFEGKTVPEAEGALTVNGKSMPLRSIRSDAAFVASGAPVMEFWHFLEAALPEHGGKVSLHLNTQDPTATVSVWLLADKARESNAAFPNELPSPERVSLDSLCVLKPTALEANAEEVHKPAPVERIKGVFLDSMEPVSATQGWETLKKNRSVWDKEMVIGEKNFLRGLGTHANSEIIYKLDGKYRRFQASAGPDMATNGSMGFTVVVDGKRCWESGKMVRGDAAKDIDIDVTGAKELRLLVDDAGDNIMGDHADWANAKLLLTTGQSENPNL